MGWAGVDYRAQPCLAPAPRAVWLLVVPGCSPEGAGAELGGFSCQILLQSEVSGVSLRPSVSPGAVGRAPLALCLLLTVGPRPGPGRARGARCRQEAAPSPPGPGIYGPASLLLCLQARRFISFPTNSFKEKAITLSHAA